MFYVFKFSTFAGSNNADFHYMPSTGDLTVASGKTIAASTVSSYTLSLTATPDGTSAAGTTILTIEAKSTCGSGAAQFTAVLGLLFLAVFAPLSV